MSAQQEPVQTRAATVGDTKNVSMVRAFYTSVFMERSLASVDDVVVGDYINHSSFVENGRENFKAYFRHYYKTFRESGAEIVHIFEQGDRVCVYANHWASSRLFGVRFKAIDVYRVEGGKLVEHWDAVEGLNGFSRFVFVVKAVLGL